MLPPLYRKMGARGGSVPTFGPSGALSSGATRSSVRPVLSGAAGPSEGAAPVTSGEVRDHPNPQ